MLRAAAKKHTLQFKQPSGTSRGVLRSKNSWIISVWDDAAPEVKGVGEASIIEGLSPEWNDQYERFLFDTIENIENCSNSIPDRLHTWPSIRFAIETALLDLKNDGKQILFPSDFTAGKSRIPINGLIWMGSKEFMNQQIQNKIEAGYSCIKMKIGAIDFDTEVELLASIRKKFPKEALTLRVDANGAFGPDDALHKLETLARLDIHSIEQPIRAGQFEAMRQLCSLTPLPIALDEDLIGHYSLSAKEELLQLIQPQFIILKPSLTGGFESSDEWIILAEKKHIGWWITSALESNIGLNAIAQYTYTKNCCIPQGLGTGQLFTNNFPSDLKISNGYLFTGTG